MRNKRMIIACIVMMGISIVSLHAQKLSRFEQLNAQRVAFITEKLQLTPEEAQAFWPVYNEYRRKKNELEQTKNQLIRNYAVNRKTLSDEEIEKIADRYVQLEQKQADLLVTYHAKFKKVLPIKKVLMLYRVERQFTTYLLQQIRNQRRRR